MTTTIENLHTNKRKFISDVEVFSPSTRNLSITNQVETSCNTKKIKIVETEEIDDKMICENSDLHTQKLDNTKPMLVPQHCNRICDADGSPTTLMIRCYCDPYRLNALIPYDSDIY